MLVALSYAHVLQVHGSGPFITVAGPTTVTIDLGNSEQCGAVAQWGSGVISYQWYVNNTAVLGANCSRFVYSGNVSNVIYWIFTPLSVGNYIIGLGAKDLNTGETAAMFNATLTVNTAVSVSMSPSNVTMYVGQSLTFTENATGGTPPYRFWWYLNYANPPVYFQPWAMNSSWSSWTFTPKSPGAYVVECLVQSSSQTDFEYSFSQDVHNSTTFVAVNPAPISDPPRGWSLLLLYLRTEASGDGWFRPWGCHPAIPV